MKSFSSFDFCMRRKCKSCERNAECNLLNFTLKNRLMYKPFENLDKILEKKKNGNLS